MRRASVWRVSCCSSASCLKRQPLAGVGAARCKAWPPLLHRVAFCMCPACRFEEVLANSPVDAVIDLVGGEYETRSLQVSLRLGSSYCGAQERSPLLV